MLQLSLLLLFLPYFAWAQVLRTTGNLQIKARDCVKIYIKGEAVFSDSTKLAGKADFQVTGGTNRKDKTFDLCPVIFEGCQITPYVGSWVDIFMSNREMGNIEVELFDLNGKGFSKIFSETKTTPTWTYRLDISDLPAGTYFVQIKLKGRKYCSRKIGNLEIVPPCMSLFPNPVEDVLTIQNLGEKLQDGDRVSYEIWDMQSRPMSMPYKAQNAGEQKWAIKVSHLAAGTYVLKFGNCPIPMKFVKQ